MGIEFFNVNQYGVGFNPNIKLNKTPNRVHFGQNVANDSFVSTSPTKLVDEALILKTISQSPEVKKILSENNMPVRLNMKELNDLMENHCKETQNIAVSIANNLVPALRAQVNIKDLKDGAMLHDFGKVLIPPEILNKPGSLTESEHQIMDLHTILGYELLKNMGVNDQVLKLVKNHHGNVDKDFIPDINLQILNLADKYSALTENRVYRNANTSKEALTIIYREVQKGEVHPFLFNALVKSVSPQSAQVNQNI